MFLLLVRDDDMWIWWKSERAYRETQLKLTDIEEDREKAYLLFLVRHNLPFSTARDPVLRMMCLSLTYGRLLALLQTTAQRIKRAVVTEAKGKLLSLMVDGWSDMSLRHFLGRKDTVTHHLTYFVSRSTL